MAVKSFSLYGGVTAEVDASASVVSQTDTQATIRVTMKARLKYSNSNVWSSGVKAKATVNGTAYGQQRIFGVENDHSGNEWVSVTRDHKVNKGASSKNVAWKAEFHSWVDGTDLGEKAEISGTVKVDAITYQEPNAPTDFAVERVSDSKNVLTWESPSTSVTQPCKYLGIERSIDGGEWSQIDSIDGSATSYNDSTTSANHSYRYRIRSWNSAGYSDYVESDETYNTPSAPTSVAVSRLAETTVAISIANAANTASALELQRSTDGSAWEAIATVEGSPVTEATDAPGGGTFYYRARNKRGDLVSDWSPASNAVVTICAPAAPTLKSPASGAVVSKSQETITFEHAHNPIDGSGQRAAQYRLSTDKGASYDYIDIEGDAQKLEVENTFAVNTEITYGVRTKGAHDDWGPWSDNRVIFVRQSPSVAFAQPADGFVVQGVPIHVELQYVDESGSLVGATLAASEGSRVVYKRDMGSQIECDITASEWFPEDGKTYTLAISVRSSSTLTATATREVSVSYKLPKPPAINVIPDPETGYVEVVVVGPDNWDSPRLGTGVLGFMVIGENAAEFAEVASISLYRVHEGQRILLGDGLQVGASVIDRYAPLNVDYSYEAVSFAETGAANAVPFASKLVTPWWFVYFDGGMAKAMWEPSGSRTPRRTKDELIERDGSTWPVLIQGKNLSHKVDFSGWVETKDEADAFEDMTLASGGKVYKGLKGEVFHCHAEADITDCYDYADDSADVKVSITRVRGGAL